MDTEYNICGGNVRVGRYHWTSIHRELESQAEDDDLKQLVVGQAGLIDSLHWIQHKPSMLQADELEMEIRCVGLNFKDIMITMGIFEGLEERIGLEASGVITRVGSAVDHVKVGDRVLATSSGLFQTRKVTPSDAVFPIPPNFTFEEAVTLPTVYMTAIHAIINLGGLEEGQSILIHSAAGGVGQAAIHICQMLGAKIFATVGREEKVQYLIENHNIPRERIFNSRDDSFLEGVMRATSGQGVDLVLNSLSGDLLHTSWKCVAECGKMMEIGKRDIIEHGRLPLDMFDQNRSFHGIDLDVLSRKRPGVMRSLINQLSDLTSKGYIKPIQPIHTYPVQEVSNAFRLMKSGQHTGKIVITMPENPKEIIASTGHEPLILSGSSTYLIIRGLGGLGKAVTTLMVEKGARSFVFLSRSAGTSENDLHFLQELKSQDCKAVAIAGSVAKMTDVNRALDAAPTLIAGVLQMSMVLRDRPFFEMTYDDWSAVQEPKVKGTWNLHNALLGTDLKFFVLISSLVALSGHTGQANYSSANSFLDSFVQYRHSLGLPCSVLNLGYMEGIGIISEQASIMKIFISMGIFMLQEQDLVEAINVSINQSNPSAEMESPSAYKSLSNKSQLVVGLGSTKPSSNPHNRVVFKGDLRFDMYNNMDSVEQTITGRSDDAVRTFLHEVEANPKILDHQDKLEYMSTEIGRTLFGFLLLPKDTLDIHMLLGAVGIDSLVVIELRNWLRKELRVNLSVLELTNAETIEGIGKLVISSLQQRYRVDGIVDGKVDSPDTVTVPST